MKVKVCGKQHRKGTSSKTGNPYDFWVIYYLTSRRGVTGEVGDSKIVEPSLFDFEAMTIPGEFVVEFDDRGNIVALAAAKG